MQAEGKLVSSDTVVGLIKDAIKNCPKEVKVVLFDGFPRSMDN